MKPEYFVSDILLEGIGMRTVISGSKLCTVPLIKFNTDLMERIVIVAKEDQEYQDANNVAKIGNPTANVYYLHDTLYHKGSL
jgi:hypothetical protein